MRKTICHKEECMYHDICLYYCIKYPNTVQDVHMSCSYNYEYMIFHLFNVCNLCPGMIKNVIMNLMLCIIISE